MYDLDESEITTWYCCIWYSSIFWCVLFGEFLGVGEPDLEPPPLVICLTMPSVLLSTAPVGGLWEACWILWIGPGGPRALILLLIFCDCRWWLIKFSSSKIAKVRFVERLWKLLLTASYGALRKLCKLILPDKDSSDDWISSASSSLSSSSSSRPSSVDDLFEQFPREPAPSIPPSLDWEAVPTTDPEPPTEELLRRLTEKMLK